MINNCTYLYYCLRFTLALSPTQTILSTWSQHPHTVARPAQRTSQVAEVSSAVRALRAPLRKPFFNKHTHALPTSALLLSKYKQAVRHCTLGGGQLEKQQFSHHDKSTLIRTKRGALLWLTLTTEKISFSPSHHLIICAISLRADQILQQGSRRLLCSLKATATEKKKKSIKELYSKSVHVCINASHTQALSSSFR